MVDQRKLRVAVLFGGRSGEHEVSLMSARFVVASLDRSRFEPILIGIDKNGRWLLQEEALLESAARDPRLLRLNQAMPEVALSPCPTREHEASLAIAGAGPTDVDVVFPVLHGPMGEDGCIQGLLELSRVPYVGAGVLGSAVGMDKDLMKRLLAGAELPVVPWISIRRSEQEKDPRRVIEQAEQLGYPLFVKPANLGSSVGIRRVKDRAALAEAIDYAFEFDTKIVVEQGLPSPREIECALLGNDDPIASVPGEIVVDHPDGFYSYAAKYIDEKGASLSIPARLDPGQASAVQLLAIQTFRVLECRGLARVDFFMTSDGKLYVNEINTLPGFTAISMYPKLWEASGIHAQERVSRLVDLAIERANERNKLRVSA